MAISKKPFLAFLFSTMLVMLVSFCSMVNASDSLSFTYGNFGQDEKDLIFQGDANVISTTNVLQLTKTNGQGVPQQQTFGRALFSAPLRLWQKSTGRVSGFESTIKFVLTSPTTTPSDGFAFFIAPIDTNIPIGTLGGYLGLFNSKTALNASASQVVAVEFDTFYGGDNIWDPNYTHIGINVNTIQSSAYVKWDRVEGAIGTAHIYYNSSTKNLTVVSSYPHGIVYTVSYVVDFKNVLPEWVRVGISGASGGGVQLHTIKQWDFFSSLHYTNPNNNNIIMKKEKEDDIIIAPIVV
ncbi:hypothetical protein TanjilG_01263 [Lupinus angustifolius]|uniref:Legume lectin domain-containing protein n=1 Tax=Lupinus angustifolius TaxID=3871 RepID=A0A4P1RE95_LUPAN|nr:PREDICTED: mannose/glucose-specific lectin-like [Lupinus angustifolius]OIW09292.1 hypothetical protein TanjilG_01263 [Lupinus angustifolius]